MNKSSIAKTLRTSIADLDIGGDLSDEQLACVAGGTKDLTITVCIDNKCTTYHACAQDTGSLTSAGTPDTMTDKHTD